MFFNIIMCLFLLKNIHYCTNITKEVKMDNKKSLGKRIKEFRKMNGLTQEKLAEAIDIETASLSAIESGRHFPSLPTIEKIATVLNIEIKALFDFKSLVSAKEMKEEIIKHIDKLNDKEIAFIYKFVDCYIDA